jgi:mannose-6-phosphate isomerase-like protein (cupin superfamily)
MKGLVKKVEQTALENTYFRQVLETGDNTQIVVMSIAPGEEIGAEVHDKEDQVLYFAAGSGEAVLDGETQPIVEGDIVLVRHGTDHNFKNTGKEDLKIITTYSPPHHPSGTVHKTKKEADAAGY